MFITKYTYSVLENSKAEKAFNVPNSHEVIKEDQVSLWKLWAEKLGIDYEATEYTLRVSKGNVYKPHLAQVDGEACLVWGKVNKPLKDIESVDINIVGDDKAFLELGFGHGHSYYSDTFTLMLTRDKESKAFQAMTSSSDLRAFLQKALKTNKLAEYLSQGFKPAMKLGDISGQTVTVTGYTINNFCKYELITKKGNILANTSISRKLDREPVITEDAPATLTVSKEPRDITKQGHPIWDVVFKTKLDKEVPVFNFDDV